MALQKYGHGSLGITPHRDRLTYVDLISIVVLGAGEDFSSVPIGRAGTLGRSMPRPAA